MASTSDDTVKQAIAPLEVTYCEVCTFPLEYCEFGSSFTKCKDRLKADDPDLYEKYYSEEALQAKLGTLSLEAQNKLEKDTAAKEAKAEKKADAAMKKKMASQITIKRIERNKRKHVTAIHGLEAFDVDLKKVAKQFAQKFATGASVTKNPQGQDEIVVQGDTMSYKWKKRKRKEASECRVKSIEAGTVLYNVFSSEVVGLLEKGNDVAE
ncbi:Translation machinery-associated protein 22 [Abortiporus biennis]